MTKGKVSAKQVAADKKALRTIRNLGLSKGKIDLRKNPTPAQKRLIARFKDVITGKAAVVTPPDAKKYKGVFKVVGNKVIVPRRKGEKITIEKRTGDIVSKRKVGGRTVTTRGMILQKGEMVKPPENPTTQYAVPFRVKGGGVRWQRFTSWSDLNRFMREYEVRYPRWKEYVVEEMVGQEQSAAALTALVEKMFAGQGSLSDQIKKRRSEQRRKQRRVKGAKREAGKR
jgi:hypothetical protein